MRKAEGGTLRILDACLRRWDEASLVGLAPNDFCHRRVRLTYGPSQNRTQGKDLQKMYSEVKFKALIKSRTETGWYDDDEDFPNDEMERWYWVRLGKKAQVKQTSLTCLDMRTEVNTKQMCGSSLRSARSKYNVATSLCSDSCGMS